MVSRDPCPSRPNAGGTYGYPYYFHRGEVLASRPTLVGRLLLLPWLFYREYPPGAGRSPFTQQSIYSGIVGVSSIIHRRMRIWGDTPIKGPPEFSPGPIMRHRGTCLRSPDAFAPHRVFSRIYTLFRDEVFNFGNSDFFVGPIKILLIILFFILSNGSSLLEVITIQIKLWNLKIKYKITTLFQTIIYQLRLITIALIKII